MIDLYFFIIWFKNDLKIYTYIVYIMSTKQEERCQEEEQNISSNPVSFKETHNGNKDVIDKTNNVAKKKLKDDYYKLHKEKFTARVNCECGGHYSRNTRYNHFKSSKHVNTLRILNEKNKQLDEMAKKLNTVEEKSKIIDAMGETLNIIDEKNKQIEAMANKLEIIKNVF